MSDRLGSPAATTPPHLQQALMTGTGRCHSPGCPGGVATPPRCIAELGCRVPPGSWPAAATRLNLNLARACAPPFLSMRAGLWQLAVSVDVIEYEELSFGKLLGAGGWVGGGQVNR
jgi:hypothetical protein